jgi:hypothetical protein
MVNEFLNYFAAGKLRSGNYYYHNNFHGADNGLYRENSSYNKGQKRGGPGVDLLRYQVKLTNSF